jgi:hypothetical protein
MLTEEQLKDGAVIRRALRKYIQTLLFDSNIDEEYTRAMKLFDGFYVDKYCVVRNDDYYKKYSE